MKDSTSCRSSRVELSRTVPPGSSTRGLSSACPSRARETIACDELANVILGRRYGNFGDSEMKLFRTHSSSLPCLAPVPSSLRNSSLDRQDAAERLESGGNFDERREKAQSARDDSSSQNPNQAQIRNPLRSLSLFIFAAADGSFFHFVNI